MQSELTLDKAYRRGDRGRGVKQVQEWLNLHGITVGIDSDFGPKTEQALKQFQTKAGLPATGVADAATFDKLVAPMKAALAPIAPNGRSLGELEVAYAEQHLRQHPREVGGQNCGPWVRLYLDGKEGTPWAWCAGFATYCMRQAAAALNVPERALPLPRTYSCDALGEAARRQQRLLVEPSTREQRSRIKPGSLFLRRTSASDWNHTGIIVSATDTEIRTIEGNTNDDGSREGYEVCARTRGYKGLDIALL
jgi:peptidoglycan hydrolase-like protein with peptidoglycan-binding domain